MSNNHDVDDEVGGIATIAGLAFGGAMLWKLAESFLSTANENEIQRLYREAQDYQQRGLFQQAVNNLNQVISKNPQFLLAYNARAWIYATHNFELNQALADINHAIQMAPDEKLLAMFLDTRGEILLRLNYFDEALSDFSNSLRLEPNSEQLNPNYSTSYRIGLCFIGKNDLANASMWLQRAIGFTPSNPEIYSRAGDVSLGRGFYTKALEYFHKAIEQVSQWPIPPDYINNFLSVVWLNISVVHYHLKDYKQCYHSNLESIKYYPHNPFAILNLSSLSARDNDEPKMRYWLERGIPLIDANFHSSLVSFLLGHPNFDEYRDIVLDLLLQESKISLPVYQQHRDGWYQKMKKQSNSLKQVYYNTRIENSILGGYVGGNGEIAGVEISKTND